MSNMGWLDVLVLVMILGFVDFMFIVIEDGVYDFGFDIFVVFFMFINVVIIGFVVVDFDIFSV